MKILRNLALALLPLLAAARLSAQFSAAVLANNPVGYWQLDETSGTTAVDASGNGLTGTYHGTPSFAQIGALAPTDSAVAFSSASSFMSAALPSSLLGSGAKTVALWVNPSNIANNALFFMGNAPGGGGSGQSFRFTTDGSGNLMLDVSSGVQSSNVAITLNNWNYVFAEWNGTNYQVGTVADGIVNRFTLSGISATANLVSSGGEIDIARNAVGGGGVSATAIFDDVAVYNSALSDTQLLTQFNASVVPEPSAYAALAGAAMLAVACLRRRRATV